MWPHAVTDSLGKPAEGVLVRNVLLLRRDPENQDSSDPLDSLFFPSSLLPKAQTLLGLFHRLVQPQY